MKHPFLFLLFLFPIEITLAQNVGIGTNSPHPSAKLDISSIDKGLLISRVALVNVTSASPIVSPEAGLLVYNKNAAIIGGNGIGFYYWTGIHWSQLITNSGSAAGWTTNGNAGTTNANFIGTIDNQSLHFKVNNQPFGILNQNNSNIALGENALRSNTTGTSNIAFGREALHYNNSKKNLIAIGDSSLFNNDLSMSSDALQSIDNIAIGSKSQLNNDIGSENTSIGIQSLYFSYSGNKNVAIGKDALYNNTFGHNNIAIGNNALYTNYYGNSNVAIGIDALHSNYQRSNLVAIGDSALYNNSIGALGYEDSRFNTAVGSKSLFSNNTGYGNSGLGTYTLQYNTSGYKNTASGAYALCANTIGIENTAVGHKALFQNLSGIVNVAIGNNALVNNKTGNANVAVGNNALEANYTGSSNSAVGFSALGNNSNGIANVGIGLNAMIDNIDGNFNTAIGSGSMFGNIHGNKNTAVGAETGAANDYRFNTTTLGYGAQVDSNNTIVLGGINEYAVDVIIGAKATNTYGHWGFNRVLELQNPISGENVQSHFILSSAGTSGSLGGLTWAALSLPQGTELRTGIISNVFETTNQTKLSFQTRNNAGIIAERFRIQGDGNAWLQGTLTQASDARLKKNIVPLTNALETIKKINGYSYDWIENQNENNKQIGVIAQEIQQVLPELVKNNNNQLSVNYSGLIPVLIEAIKEQQKQIEALKIELKKH